MAVHQWRRVWTQKIGPVHTVDGVQRTVESRSEVADVPHPAEYRSDVDVSSAESENGEENGQDGSDENSKLEEK